MSSIYVFDHIHIYDVRYINLKYVNADGDIMSGVYMCERCGAAPLTFCLIQIQQQHSNLTTIYTIGFDDFPCSSIRCWADLTKEISVDRRV